MEYDSACFFLHKWAVEATKVAKILAFDMKIETKSFCREIYSN